MANDRQDHQPGKVERGIKDMEIKSSDSDSQDEGTGTIRIRKIEQPSTHTSGASSPTKIEVKTATRLPEKPHPISNTPIKRKGEYEQLLGGEITLKLEPGQPPKLSRTASQKVMARAPQMFDHYEDKTQEATGLFQIITQCSYSAKNLGSTEHAMECDCVEEWGKNDCSPYIACLCSLER